MNVSQSSHENKRCKQFAKHHESAHLDTVNQEPKLLTVRGSSSNPSHPYCLPQLCAAGIAEGPTPVTLSVKGVESDVGENRII